MSTPPLNKCDEAIASLKLKMGNSQHIYIAELVGKLKARRATLAKALEEKRTSPALEKTIASLELNIIYQIEHPIAPEE